MALLPSILSDSPKSRTGNTNPFILIQSSAAQSALPVLRKLVESNAANGNVILISTLYTPEDLLGRTYKNDHLNVRALEWTSYVPGYSDEEHGYDQKVKGIDDAVKGLTGPLTVIVDSVDTVVDDFGSSAKTYKFLSGILATLRTRKDPSRLICHLTPTSRMGPLLIDTSFSTSLVHLTAHPPVLLTHIASAYLTPPPLSPSGDPSPEDIKFWRVFLPLSERAHEVEALVFGADGEGGGGGGLGDEFVVEVLVRGRSNDRQRAVASGSRRRGVERSLEGWNAAKGGPVPLESLESLKSAFKKNASVDKDAPDPTKNLTFNLNLTESQQASRSQVPLPYEHDGNAQIINQKAPGQIFYDPDSADDLDDEDPDEDLDI